MRQVIWTIADLAQVILKRQQNEFDVVIVIDGQRGNGKSTLAYKLLTKTGKFVPEKDIMFTREDVVEALKTRKFSCIDADEMINSAHNRDFFSGDQKTFIKIMNMYRDNYNILVGSVPYFYDLDPQIRKLVKIRLSVVKRGVAIVQMSKSSLYTNDVWEQNINKKIEESWINKTHKGKLLLPKYNRLTTYVGHLFFTPLSPDQEKKYKALKVFKRSQMKLDTEEKKKEYWEEANELIETGRIKGYKQLSFYLLGKGILYTKGLKKITTFRKDMGYETTLKDIFSKKKDIADEELVEENEEGKIPIKEALGLSD